MEWCAVCFMGGPIDGDSVYLPCGDPPPYKLSIDMDKTEQVWVSPQEMRWVVPGSQRHLIYIRRVSQLPDGPRWVYIPEDIDAA